MTGPKIIASEGVHSDRMGATRYGKRRLVVLHTTEGWEGVDRAEQVVAMCKTKGTVPSKSRPGGFSGPSYHGVFDTDCTRMLVPFDRVAYSAPGANNDGLHFVFPTSIYSTPNNRVLQTREEWLDPISSGLAIVQAAELIVELERTEGIPAVRLTVAEVVAGKSGYCDHGAISKAYKQTDHTDVGSTFPWDHLEALIAALKNPARPDPETPEQPPAINPSEEDEVKYIWLVSKDPTNRPEALVAVDGSGVTFIPVADPEDVGRLQAKYGAEYTKVATSTYDSYLAASRA